MCLPAEDFHRVSWSQGSKGKLRSRFAAIRVRPAHRDYWRQAEHKQLWLLIEWPKDEKEPTKYWLANLAPQSSLKSLVFWPNYAGVLNAITKNSGKNWAWGTMKAGDGAAFITMPLSVLRRMGSWWQRSVCFSSARACHMSDYRLRKCRPTSSRAVRPRTA